MILDFIIIGIFLIIAFVGYKVGFFRTILGVASVISGLIVSLFLTAPITRLLFGWGVGSGLSDNFYGKFTTGELATIYNNAGGGQAGIRAILIEIKVPGFFADIFSAKASGDTFEVVCRSVADGIAKLILGVIVFIVLLFATSLIIWILKKVFKGLRDSSRVIRFIDGLAGILAFTVLYVGVIFIFFTVLSYKITSDSSFIAFFNKQLFDPNVSRIGLSTFLWENNVIGNFIHILF